PVPKDRIDDYRRVAEQAALVRKEYGALEYWACDGDDLDAADMVSFRDLAQAGPQETVSRAWVARESREQRDRANERIMADPRMAEMMDPDTPIFDYKRMAYGGFKELVHA